MSIVLEYFTLEPSNKKEVSNMIYVMRSAMFKCKDVFDVRGV